MNPNNETDTDINVGDKANNTEDVELELLVRATQYVMKQDPVLKEYSRHSPGHFVRIIERMLEFNQQEANRQKKELLDELWQASQITPALDGVMALYDLVELKRRQLEGGK